MITGPRQSGKTTLAKMACPDLPYVNFESPFEQARFHEDPVGYLANFPEGAILDEAQHAPQLLSYLQVRVDADGKMGQWVLTGSQQPELSKLIGQSLAGRVAVMELLPFSFEEVSGEMAEASLAQAVLKGGYPPLFDDRRELSTEEWLDHYLATYVNRDVQSVIEIRERVKFDVFLRYCASLSGQLLNKADVAQTAEINKMTSDAWVSVLETTYLAKRLLPHHRNFGKRLNKRPKLHFLDTGVVCRLLHLSTVNQLTLAPQWGSLVETWVYGEVLKWFRNRGKLDPLWFWRSSDGFETDLLIDRGNVLYPIEIKSSATPSLTSKSGVTKLRELQTKEKGVEVADGMVIYGGAESRKLNGISYVPWNRISEGLEELLR